MYNEEVNFYLQKAIKYLKCVKNEKLSFLSYNKGTIQVLLPRRLALFIFSFSKYNPAEDESEDNKYIEITECIGGKKFYKSNFMHLSQQTILVLKNEILIYIGFVEKGFEILDPIVNRLDFWIFLYFRVDYDKSLISDKCSTFLMIKKVFSIIKLFDYFDFNSEFNNLFVEFKNFIQSDTIILLDSKHHNQFQSILNDLYVFFDDGAATLTENTNWYSESACLSKSIYALECFRN